MNHQLYSENLEYWTHRAPSYSEINRTELKGCQRKKWKNFLSEKIDAHHFGKPRSEIRILDIGAGPGFLTIVLTEAGYTVTAADFSHAMIKQAQQNAGDLASNIRFMCEDAMDLSFRDASFDVVLSRNLTWNLPAPEKAYSEWLRILSPGGMLLVFDANWYAYLFDEGLRKAYDRDREIVAEHAIEDYNIGENFDMMEEIAGKMPLSPKQRPTWDIKTLHQLGVTSVYAEENVGEILYSEEEMLNYRSTPMFCINAIKR